MTDQKIEQILITDLRPWAKNARTHSKKQLKQIGESIRTFGFTNPVLIDGADTILAGHGRVVAARLIGMSAVPCVRLERMSADQIAGLCVDFHPELIRFFHREVSHF